MIIKAESADHLSLTELTMRSKNHWGYGAEQIEQWKKDLTITEVYIKDNSVYKLLQKEKLIGYYAILDLADQVWKIDNLFVDPDYIGQGWGRLLLADILAKAKQQSIQKITLDADPNATAFYARYGFKVIDQIPTSIPNRFLPVMIYTL